MEVLRDPKRGCPWNIKQTHQSVKRHLLEEAYETLEAIDSEDPTEIKEELGDLLFQVVFHAQMASEKGNFTFDDVVKCIDDKMIRRHPHVFGEKQIDEESPMADLDKMWEEVKAAEKTTHSVFENIPTALPSLARAVKILKKADKHAISSDEYLAGYANDNVELQRHIQQVQTEEQIGQILLLLASQCKELRLDPEEILRQEAQKLQKHLETNNNGK